MTKIAVVTLAVIGVLATIGVVVLLGMAIFTARSRRRYRKQLDELREYLTEHYPGLLGIIHRYDAHGLLGLATVINVSLRIYDTLGSDGRDIAFAELAANGIDAGHRARVEFLDASWDDLRHISKLITPP